MLEVLPGQQQQVRRALRFRDAGCLASTPRTRPLAHLGDSSASSDGRSRNGGGRLRELLPGDRATEPLSAQNVLFLRIRRLAGLRQFDAISACPSWRRFSPSAGQHACRQASGSRLHNEIAGYEADGDTNGACHFERRAAEYPALFKSRRLASPRGDQEFHTAHLAVRPDDAESAPACWHRRT
jgi:hypothetical protein